MLYLEDFFRSPLNMFGDRVAVSRPCEQSTKDEKVERALQQLYTGRRLSMHCVGILLIFV